MLALALVTRHFRVHLSVVGGYPTHVWTWRPDPLTARCGEVSGIPSDSGLDVSCTPVLAVGGVGGALSLSFRHLPT